MFRKKKEKLYCSELGKCYATMFFVVKNSIGVTDDEVILKIMATWILKKQITDYNGSLDFTEVDRVVRYSKAGMHDIRFTMSPINNPANWIMEGGRDIKRVLTLFSINVRSLQLFLADSLEKTNEFSILKNHEKDIYDAITGIFDDNSQGLLVSSLNYRGMLMDFESVKDSLMFQIK